MRGMRGVGGVCEMCLARAACVERGGGWMRGLALGFINPLGTGEVLDVCLCFGFGCAGGEWGGDLGGVMSV